MCINTSIVIAVDIENQCIEFNVMESNMTHMYNFKYFVLSICPCLNSVKKENKLLQINNILYLNLNYIEPRDNQGSIPIPIKIFNFILKFHFEMIKL